MIGGGTEGRAARRLAILQQLTASLAKTRTYDEVGRVIIDEARPALDAEVGVVAVLSDDGRMLRNVGFEGVDEKTRAAWQAYPVESPVPVAEAALRGEPILVRTLEERNRRYPVLAQVHGLEHGGPVATFPLFVDGKLLGVLGLCWGSERDMDDDDLVFLRTLADQCGLALDRSRLFDELRRASERKDEFLAMLAHELRNPLAPIRAATELLGQIDEGRVTRLHAVLDRQTTHMKRIVDDLLDASRLTRNRLSIEPQKTDLVELVKSTLADHATAFDAAGIAVVSELPSGTVWSNVDAVRIAQAITNILQNALELCGRGGHVRVRLDEKGVIEIADDGVGIEPELLARVFEPFAQGERTLARSRGGLGLGLSLVKGFVELHGGTVAASSDGPGRGATFRIVLPVVSSPRRGRRRAVPPPQPNGKRVLVVEDNVDAAELLAMLVGSIGHRVELAADALQALDLLERFDPEIVLSDIGLPGMDGYELGRRIRARKNGSEPVLVAVSGYGSENDKAQARAAGFDAYLTKPVDRATLERVLASHQSGSADQPISGSALVPPRRAP